MQNDPNERSGLIRQVSDSLLADLELLEQLEADKRQLPVTDPRVADLARQVEALARRVLQASVTQREVATEAAPSQEAGEPAISVEEAPPRPLQVVLGEWRDAERRLQSAEAGSPKAAVAAADVARLRREYARAHGSARPTPQELSAGARREPTGG